MALATWIGAWSRTAGGSLLPTETRLAARTTHLTNAYSLIKSDFPIISTGSVERQRANTVSKFFEGTGLVRLGPPFYASHVSRQAGKVPSRLFQTRRLFASDAAVKTAAADIPESFNEPSRSGLPVQSAEAAIKLATPPERIRNIAIVAHVDHGKTTLVDALLRFGGLEVSETRLLDTSELEREKGITILAKTTKMFYKGHEINIIDTPGHADFGGEVERVLSMVDGVLLLVDVMEGPQAQTRFVLRKVLQQQNITVAPIVVVNKVDRAGLRQEGTIEDDIFDLFIGLEASDEQLDYPVLYGSARAGYIERTWAEGVAQGEHTKGMAPLLDLILSHVPAPAVPQSENTNHGVGLDFQRNPCTNDFAFLVSIIERLSENQLLVSGRVIKGLTMAGAQLSVISAKGASTTKFRLREITGNSGIERRPLAVAAAGNVVSLRLPGGVESAAYDTIAADPKCPLLPFDRVDPPIVAISVTMNSSPLKGQDTRQMNSLELSTRIGKEVAINPSMSMQKNEDGSITVLGRGDLQLCVLFEVMRREGFEFEIAPPSVITKKDEVTGEVVEPWERLTILAKTPYMDAVMKLMDERHAQLQTMQQQGDDVEFKYECASRQLFGCQLSLKAATRGTVQLSSELLDHRPVEKFPPPPKRTVAISSHCGIVYEFDMLRFQDDVTFFVRPGDEVYDGQILGVTTRPMDLCINVTKGRKYSVITSKLRDKKESLNESREMPIDAALAFIRPDELVEVTPKRVAIRKRILSADLRQKDEKRAAAAAV